MKKKIWIVVGLLLGSYASAANVEVKVKDLNTEPQKFAGQEVIVTGKVDSIEGSDAFILNGKGLLNNKILVVIDKRQQATGNSARGGMEMPVIKEKEKVQLTGKVEEITVSQIEETYKPGLKPELKQEVRSTVMPVLVVKPNAVKVQG